MIETFITDNRSVMIALLDAKIAAAGDSTQQSAVPEADRAKQASIERLFEEELTQMSSKLVNLSVSVLLEARTSDELDAQTETAKSAFGSIGNSELLDEDVTQVPAFLSMLPGSGAYQLRRKGCTSLCCAISTRPARTWTAIYPSATTRRRI